MPKRDTYHQAVKNALVKDGWMITADPLRVEFGGDLHRLRLRGGGHPTMDDMTNRMTKYRDCVRRIVEGHAHPSLHPEQVETQIVIDEEHDHYLLLYVGWRGNQRIRGIVLHLDIKEGRIWVQHDGTEYGVANELVEMGIPKADIVLGFRAPHRRRDTEFAA